jgi:hypothetical protein
MPSFAVAEREVEFECVDAVDLAGDDDVVGVFGTASGLSSLSMTRRLSGLPFSVTSICFVP